MAFARLAFLWFEFDKYAERLLESFVKLTDRSSNEFGADERKKRDIDAKQLKRSNAEADALQHKQALAAAIAYGDKAPVIEKRRRAQAEANTPEAIKARNGWDVFDG